MAITYEKLKKAFEEANRGRPQDAVMIWIPSIQTKIMREIHKMPDDVIAEVHRRVKEEEGFDYFEFVQDWYKQMER